MKKFKKLTIVVLTIAVICTLIVAFAACGGKKISEISVGQAGMPRLTYVQGQDLDFSGGKLTVVSDGKTEEISLVDPDVKVTGYDKNTLGKQSVTIEYKGFETTVEVTVVPQIAVDRHTEKYFVGENLNTQVGRLKITRNDGTDFTVDLSDAKVTLSGFDSSTAGIKTVTVKYEDYTGTFDVEVFAAAKATLRSPNKNAYLSHEEGIDLAGGYLTLENADGSLKKQVPISEDMISGYDLSAATIENLAGNPFRQTITVNYVGTHTFDIYITFSGVSLMKLRASELNDLDWTTTQPEITDAQGKAAVEAMQSYFNLSSLEQEMIPEADQECVARVAAVYAKTVWENEIEAFKNTFIITRQDGATEAQFVQCTLEQAQATYAKLSQTNTPVRAMEELLSNISAYFADTTLEGERKISEFLNEVYNATIFDYVLSGIEYAQDLMDLLQDVPAQWTPENIATDTVKKALDDSLDYIAANKFKGSNYGDFSLYDMVSYWRGVSAENDLMDMFYQHCFANKDTWGLNVIKSIYLPGEIAGMYGYLTACDYYLYQISNMQSFDTSFFMWLYRRYVLPTQEELKATDGLIRWAYENIDYGGGVTFDAMIEETKINYTDFCGGMYGNKTFEDLWNRLFDIMERDSAWDPSSGKPQFDPTEVEGFLKAFYEAPESVQLGFLTSVCPTYTDPEHALPVLDYTILLDDENMRVSTFSAVLAYYFDGKDGVLPQDDADKDGSHPRQLFRYLLGATEDYLRRYESVQDGMDYFTSFRVMMVGAQQEYNKLNDEDKSAFDGKVGYLYNKLMAITGLYDDKFFTVGEATAQKEVDLGTEWEEKFGELALLTYNIDELVQTNSPFIGMMFAFYAKAEALAAEILNADDTVANAYYQYNYALTVRDENQSEIVLMNMTLDHAMYLSRISFMNYLTNLTGVADDYLAETENRDSKLHTFMLKAYDFYLLALEDEDYAFSADDEALVTEFLTAYRTLTQKERWLFCNMDVRFGYSYVSMLTIYFHRTIGSTVEGVFTGNEKVTQFAIDVLGLEQSYTAYESDPNAGNLAQVNRALAEVEKSKAAMEDSDSALIPEYINKMYEYYTNLCNGLSN